MTVQKELTKNIYVGNGQTTKFPVTFECPDNHPEYIKVYVTGKNNKLTETTNFSVDMTNKAITYPANGEPLAADEQLVIMRELPVRQLMNLVNNGPFFAEDIETAFDEAIMTIQQISEKLKRTITMSVDIDGDAFVNEVPFEAGKSFRIADDGKSIVLTEDPGKVIDEAKALKSETETARDTTIENKDIAVSAANDALNSQKLVEKYKALWFSSIAAMKAEKSLKPGAVACTLGYYSPNDGGAGTYIIRAKAEGDVDDGGSLHELANGNVAELVVENGTVNVKQFGAKGDGVSDDTERVKIAIKYHVDKRYKLMFVGTFFVTASLMNEEDYTDEVYINFEGVKPLQETTYSSRNDSVILFKNGISLFQDVTLKGSIYRMTFVPQSRSTTGCIFKNCKLSSFYFMYNSVSNILAFCLDTGLSGTSKIAYNKFLTVYYFAKYETKSTACTDSTITHNYINGGEELNDNACFQWNFFNGSTVSHNFIDYYRTIYEPKSATGFYFQGPMSSMNHYQVFRYLYLNGTASNITFSSCGDIINWTDTSTLEKLRHFIAIMYTDDKGTEHELPPYTIQVKEGDCIAFNSLLIQNKVSDLIFVRSALSGYKNAHCTVKNIIINGAVNLTSDAYNSYVNDAADFYIGGKYRNNLVDIPFIKTLDELPAVSTVWGAYYLGEKVKVGDNCYRLVYSDVDNTGTAKYHWVPIYTEDYE